MDVEVGGDIAGLAGAGGELAGPPAESACEQEATDCADGDGDGTS